MAKRISTKIIDRNNKEVLTGDIVKMHFFGLGIGELGGAIETDFEVCGKVKVHWYDRNKKPHFCVEDDDVNYPFSLNGRTI